MGFYGTGLHAIPADGIQPEARGKRLRLRKDGKWVFVDTRRGGGGKEPEPTGLCLPSGIDGELAPPKREDIRRAGLFVDLGSTRTLGVVVPDLDAIGGDMTCEVLDLIDYVGGNHEEAQPFSSHVVLEGMAGEISEDTRPLSEVRTGKVASELYDVAAVELARLGGGVAKVLASSPKRLITRSEPDPAWRQVVRQGPGGDIRPYELIPSRLVGMQVVELVEQAERMLNSKGDRRAYRVTEVHVTYPPGWLGPVQEMYRQLIQKEMDAWARKRALVVRVEMGCSEALGALVFHWYNRVLQKPGMLAPQPGQDRKKKKKIYQWKYKLGVVDVGGGTSDLLVEIIEVDTLDPLKTHVSFTPACRWSVETAGDELVHRVAGEIVLPCLITRLFKAQGDRRALRQYFRAPEHGTEKRRWMRKHLLEVARVFIQKSAEGSLSPGDQNELRPHFKEIDAACKGHLARIRYGSRIDDEEAQPSDADYTQLGEDILKVAQRDVPKLAETVFGETARDFSTICKDLECKEVKLSGKAMEYAVVEKVFQEAFEKKGLDVTSLVGEEIAPLLRQGLGGMQTISDSKYATVWGCMCKRWMDHDQSHLSKNVEVSMNEVAGELEWGVHGVNARLTAESWEHRTKVAPDMEIPLASLPMALSYTTRSGRNGPEEKENVFPVRMYQLGFKRHSCQGLALKGIAKVVLKEDEKTGFAVARVVEGEVEANGVTGRLRPEDLEVTLALDYALSSFWLDAGVIEVK